jgi:multidrug efflux pump subunit AcrB
VLVNFHATVANVHIGRIDTIFSVAGILIVAAGLYAYVALPRSAAPESDPTIAVLEPA